MATKTTRTVREQPAYRHILLAILVVVLFVLISSLGYYLIEPRYSWHNAVYMTIISVTTTGYEEVGGGLSKAGRVWTIFVLLGGVVTGAVALSLIVAVVVEGRIRGLFGRRQLERKIASLSGHVVVCGYGRMGRRIAQLLKGGSKPVVVIDNSQDKTTQAEQDGVLYLLGDAQEEDVLLAAGIEKASSLIAALPNDAANVFLTLSAHGLNSSLNIIARAVDASAQDKLTKAGATRVICPLIIGSNRIADVLLRPAIADFVEMAHKGVDLEIEQITIKRDSPFAGKTLLDLALPARAGAMVVAIRHSGRETLYNPGPDAIVNEGDTIIVIGKQGMDAAMEKLRQTGQI